MTRRLIPSDWSQSDIERMSNVSSTDLGGAKIWWERRSPVLGTYLPEAFNVGDSRGIAEAKEIIKNPPTESMSRVQRGLYSGGMLWFWYRGGYYRTSGAKLRTDRVIGFNESAVDMAAREMPALAKKLQSGAISLREWQDEMYRMVMYGALASGMIAAGGEDSMTEEYLAVIGGMIAMQLRYLNELGNRIASGIQKLDGTISRLAKLYAKVGLGVFWGIDNLVSVNLDFALYKNVLGGNENHCTSGITCESVSDMGLQPIGTLTPIGSRGCRSNCLCHWQYYNPLTGEWR